MNKNKDRYFINKFIKDGYIIFNISEKQKLNYIKKKISNELSKKFKKKINLENIHQFMNPQKLNSFKMKIYGKINSDKKFFYNYYTIAQKELDLICGNEIAMQRKINLSIQLPKDDSSLLPMHSDVWSGCSPFEVVLWLPLVNCKKTQSMFIVPFKESKVLNKKVFKKNLFHKIQDQNTKKFKWLNIKYGQGLIFSHQLLHGNVVNLEKKTRWSLNCRFKSIFSPYNEKKIGETFLPINLKPASQLAFSYQDNLK